MKMKTFVYLLIQNLVLGLWPWSCKDYVCLWNACNNDLCFCVLHLKLWMLAMIQGLALQSQGSFSFIKEGSYRAWPPDKEGAPTSPSFMWWKLHSHKNISTHNSTHMH